MPTRPLLRWRRGGALPVWHMARRGRCVQQLLVQVVPAVGRQLQRGQHRNRGAQGLLHASLNGTRAYQCASDSACLGGALYGDASCAEGHLGHLCGECASGYYRSQRRCLSCADLDDSSSSEAAANAATATIVANANAWSGPATTVASGHLVLPAAAHGIATHQQRRWRR